MKTLLYAEDREDDVFFIRRACRRAGMDGRLRVNAVADGQLAIDYLTGTPPYDDREKFARPDVILLDLKMPRQSGLEVLQWIRGQANLRALPVFLLTSSNQQADIQQATSLKADGYLVKPVGIDDLTRMVEQLAAAAGLKPDTPSFSCQSGMATSR